MALILPASIRTHFSAVSATSEKPAADLIGLLQQRLRPSLIDHNAQKNRYLSSKIPTLDKLVGGGLLRGRISELTGPASTGRTSLAAAFNAAATQRGEVVGWIDGADTFDPASMALAGVDLARVLWVSTGARARATGAQKTASMPGEHRQSRLLKAAELVLDAGGFGLVVIDFGTFRYPLSSTAALRLARAAERSGTAVITLAGRRMCGTFSALSLTIHRVNARFDRMASGAPAVFDGFEVEVRVVRHKFAGAGAYTAIRIVVDAVAHCAMPFIDASGAGVGAVTDNLLASGN